MMSDDYCSYACLIPYPDILYRPFEVYQCSQNGGFCPNPLSSDCYNNNVGGSQGVLLDGKSIDDLL